MVVDEPARNRNVVVLGPADQEPWGGKGDFINGFAITAHE